MKKNPEMYVPNVASFKNDNIYLGSHNGMRFKLSPNVKEMTIHAELWHTPLCYELSEMEKVEDYPLSEEGIAAMTQWLKDNV